MEEDQLKKWRFAHAQSIRKQPLLWVVKFFRTEDKFMRDYCFLSQEINRI